MKAQVGGRRVAAAVATSVLILLAGACGGPAKTNAAKSSPTTSTTRAATTTTLRRAPIKRHPSLRGATKASRPRHRPALAVHRDPLCPLTGLPPQGGTLPKRAALAVKVENLPQARPQWGLDKADI